MQPTMPGLVGVAAPVGFVQICPFHPRPLALAEMDVPPEFTTLRKNPWLELFASP